MTALRWTTIALLVVISLGWQIVIGDVYTSMAYSNSFAWLSPEATITIVYGSIGLAVIAALLASLDLVLQEKRRYISVVLIGLSTAIVPSFWVYAGHLADTTEPAVLQK